MGVEKGKNGGCSQRGWSLLCLVCVRQGSGSASPVSSKRERQRNAKPKRPAGRLIHDGSGAFDEPCTNTIEASDERRCRKGRRRRGRRKIKEEGQRVRGAKSERKSEEPRLMMEMMVMIKMVMMIMADGQVPDKHALDISSLYPVAATVLFATAVRVKMLVEGSKAEIPRHQEHKQQRLLLCGVL